MREARIGGGDEAGHAAENTVAPVARSEERDPGLPVLDGPASNGEYEPPPLSAMAAEARRRALDMVERSVRRTGMSRRQFLLGLCGTATSLVALNACSRESNGGAAGGRFDVPTTATTDPDVAREALAGDELIIDVQGHLLDYTINPKAATFGSGFPQARCGEADPRDCFSIEYFLDLVFLQSDTDVAVLSSIPTVGDDNPLTTEVMEETRRIAAAVCGDGRILMQGQAVPNLGRLDAALDAMSELAAEHTIGSWKVYTHAGGRGWYLDDHDPDALQAGEPFLRRVVDTGVRTVSVHKGLSGGNDFASPIDIGPAAARHRDVRFVAYHSGYETGVAEGPYDAGDPGRGIDRLLASMDAAGIGPNENVYAELGSTWFNLMRSPTDAAHALGKLLSRVGADNVLWGTDSIWYGSPQPQIQAFRAFEISEELQERHGYPALTPALKAKVLGGNAARLYGVDAAAVKERCAFTRHDLEEIRANGPGTNQALGPTTSAALRAHQAAHRWP